MRGFIDFLGGDPTKTLHFQRGILLWCPTSRLYNQSASGWSRRNGPMEGRNMTTKTKTITLSFPHINQDRNHDPRNNPECNQVYRVDQVTDSTEYNPGQQLTKKQVDELCGATLWKVTIKRAA